MKKSALMSAILAVSFSSMVFADDHPPVPAEKYPTSQHHKKDKKPPRDVPPLKHKHHKHDDKKPPLPDDHR